MADPRYEIDWSADLTPALAHFAAARNASKQNARADEYLKLQQDAQRQSSERHSAEVERQKARDEHQRALETWNAMPTLQRAAMKSVGMANTNPFGVKFDETHDLPANVEGPEVSPAAEAARFAKAGATAPAQPTAPAMTAPEAPSDRTHSYATPGVGDEHPDPSKFYGNRTLFGADDNINARDAAWDASGGDANDYYNYLDKPAQQMVQSGYQKGAGINAFGEEERQRAADNLNAVGTGLNPRNVVKIDEPFVIDAEPDMAAGTPDIAPAPEHPLIAAAKNASGFEAPGPEGKRRLFASYQGQRFEVPEQKDTTPFGAEYDSVYQGLIEAGEDPHKAMQYVATQYKADQTQENIAKRTAANTAALIGGRDASREDQQTFQAQQDAQFRRTFEQSMALARAAAARHDPSGGADPATMAALAEYALKNPGDIPGLYRQADVLHAPSPGKAVTSVTGATKATESQSKDAKQAAIGLRAIDSIEKAGYTPNDKDIQKWFNNQRDVYQAQKAGEGGGLLGFAGGKLAGGMQSVGLMAKSEVEGLSPEAQKYFANVRRFMETIGRAQSGAAISNSEWTNFMNQYGPQSPGGLSAARQYMEDQLRASGVAGRSIAPNAPTRGGGPSDALRAKAERALNDPNAPPEAKAAARKILGR